MVTVNENFQLVATLKACAKRKDLYTGIQLHADILKRGLLDNNCYIASSLISLYSKCGALEKAQKLHDDLRFQSVSTWNALIAGYAQCGQSHEALNCFKQMERNSSLSPNSVTYMSVLKACGAMKAIDKGEKFHVDIIQKGFLRKNVALGNALIDMYVKCDVLTKAQQLLEELPERDTFSWSALIAGYARNGKLPQALQCLECMQSEGHIPDAVTFASILSACGSTRAVENGKRIHDEIVKRGLLENSILLGNALVDMYAKCGLLRNASKMLTNLPVRDVFSWSSLISGYTKHGQGKEALKCFEKMRNEGICPDIVAFTCILNACGSTGSIENGELIHHDIIERGLLKKNNVIGNALVDMYGKCGVIVKAKEVFDEIPVRDIVSWSALISGYAQLGRGHEALNCFERLKIEGLFPHVVIFTCILKACGSTGATDKGKQIHNEIVNRGFLQSSAVIGNCLVDMYVKCGQFTNAHQVHSEFCFRNVVSWSALMAGYARHGQGHEALQCFEQSKRDGICPDMITFTCILKACGSTGAIEKGKEIHGEIAYRGLLKKDVALGNALVDMYAKCGMLAKAEEVHEELLTQNIISWSALIAGYARQGKAYEAFNCLKRMQGEGLSPDAVALLCILNACSHSGLFNEAQIYFGNMNKKYGIAQNLEHGTCMVVNFGCAGQFDLAISMFRCMPSYDRLSVWLALLVSCKKWGNVKLGALAFDHAIQLENDCTAAYILMADIYAAAEDANRIQQMSRGGVTV